MMMKREGREKNLYILMCVGGERVLSRFRFESRIPLCILRKLNVTAREREREGEEHER